MTAAVVLDLVLIVLLVWQFLAGWQRGLVGTLLALAGIVAGVTAGVLLLPFLPRTGDLRYPEVRVVVAIGAMGLAVLVGHRFGILAGDLLRRGRPPSGPGPALSRLLGGVLTVSVTAVLLWSLAVAVRGATETPFASVVGRSTVLRAIDRVVPGSTMRVFLPLQQALDREGFPRVFDGIGWERIVDVAPPDAGVAGTDAVRVAQKSVVKVTTSAPRCGRNEEGSGWVVADGVVVTNAHVVAGSDGVTVAAYDGQRWPGRVVEFDPRRDIAVIRVDGLPLPKLLDGTDLQRGDPAAVSGYPLDGPLRTVPARVREVLTASGADIYGSPGVVREMYAVRGTVLPGNSGGPLLNRHGEVVGVVFARSTDHADTGYVLTMDEASPAIKQGLTSTESVATGACTA